MPDLTRRQDLPTAAEFAQLVRDGGTLTEVGAPHGLSARSIQTRLNDAGWSRAGEPHTFKLAPRPNAVEVPEQGEWVARRACGPDDAELFFPDNAREERKAKAICGVCDVRTECLTWGMRVDKVTDKADRPILGGFTGRERHALRRKLKGGN